MLKLRSIIMNPDRQKVQRSILLQRIPPCHFHCASGVSAQILACKLDSLARVSRRDRRKVIVNIASWLRVRHTNEPTSQLELTSSANRLPTHDITPLDKSPTFSSVGENECSTPSKRDTFHHSLQLMLTERATKYIKCTPACQAEQRPFRAHPTQPIGATLN